MVAHKAYVKGGRLILDEPTDLPDGEVVELVAVADLLARGADDLDDDERARLHESLRRGLAEADAGETVDASVVLADLRAQG